MEDNNVINQETELTENNDVLTAELITEDDLETGSSGLAGVGIAALAILGGVAAIAYKKRDKINERRTERQIKRLQKKGYNISKIEVFESEDDVESEEDTEE